MPRVSIIIPTHSRPALLPRAVRSAQEAGADVEVIVVDDASTDETARVCRALEGIKYLRLDHNRGVAGARNLGILFSSADYISFLDDDDLRLPGSLDEQVEILEAHPEAGFVCGAMLYADQDGNLTGRVASPRHPGGDVFWELLGLDFPVMPISVVIRKSCFFRVGLLDDGLRGIDDWDIFVRIAELYPVAVMNRSVSVYRQPTPSSGQGSSALAPHLSKAARHQLKLLELPRAKEAAASRRREIRRAALRRITNTMLWDAAERLREGNYRLAASNVLAVLRLNPSSLARPAGYMKLAAHLLSKPA